MSSWHPTPVLLPGKSHGQRSLVGCSPWGREELDTTEQLHFHFSLSCIGEGNGNPLQCSCLESPRDGGAWWAAVCGVAQSRTRLKLLSSSSSSKLNCAFQSKILPCLKSFSNLIYFMSYFPCSLIRSFSLLNSKVLRTFPTLLFIFMLTILFVCFYPDSETLIRVYCLS